MRGVPIGNDVIDLEDVQIVDHHLRPRFLARVLAEEERDRLARTPDADKKRLLWTCFAAKEAAYKAIVKLRGPIVLAHRSLVMAPARTSVRYRDLAVDLEIEDGQGFVHAIAFVMHERPIARVERVADDQELSLVARRTLC